MKLRVDGMLLVRGFCSRCEAERRKNSGELGIVTVSTTQSAARVVGPEVDTAPGVWQWIAHDPASVKDGEYGPYPKAGYGTTLRHPWFPDLDVPDRLAAYCREAHGTGHVDTAEVIEKALRAATGGPARVVLRFLA
jgi:hypothetical protein